MRRMRFGVVCLALVAAVLCLAGVTGAVGTASFTDPAGDSGAAPDVTSVVVSNDDHGLITFRIAVGNRTTFGPDDAVAIPFATNTPGRAGVREDGVNFVLGVEGTGVFLQRWTGTDMLHVEPSSLRGSFADGVLTLTVRQDDLAPGFPSLALPTGLTFYVLGVAFNGEEVAAEDDAPDAIDEFWTYHLVQPARVVVTYFRAPKSAKAGGSVVAHLGVARSDTGSPVKPAKVACRAKLGSRSLKRIPTRAAGYARCSWEIPKDGRGKTLHGSISLTSGATVVSRSFSTPVR
jgi:hypothetical protein